VSPIAFRSRPWVDDAMPTSIRPLNAAGLRPDASYA
jgi:hypothetical protein